MIDTTVESKDSKVVSTMTEAQPTNLISPMSILLVVRLHVRDDTTTRRHNAAVISVIYLNHTI